MLTPKLTAEPTATATTTYPRADKAANARDAASGAGLAFLGAVTAALAQLGLHVEVYWTPISEETCKVRAEVYSY